MSDTIVYLTVSKWPGTHTRGGEGSNEEKANYQAMMMLTTTLESWLPHP